MKTRLIACVMLLALSVTPVTAMNIGILGSYWNQRDGNEAMGIGVSFLPTLLPVEFRGTYYDRSAAGDVRASPIDFGLAIQLTRATAFRLTAVGGGSYYIVDSPHSDPDNEFGWYLGGRLEYPTRGASAVFGEVLYRGADLDDANVNLSGLAINIGLYF